MNWLDRFEEKHPHFGISNISFILVGCNAFGIFLSLFSRFASLLEFDGTAILKGQIWRLLTWVLSPSQGSFIMTVIFLICALSWGRSLERMIGKCRMTIFVLGGIIISDLGGLLFYAITLFAFGEGISVSLTSYYIILTIIMQVALLFPDGQVRFWFILPMRMMIMFWITLGELLFEIGYSFEASYSYYSQFTNSSTEVMVSSVLNTFVSTGQIFFALLNLLVFYLLSKNHVSRKHKKRQKEFRQSFRAAEPRPGSGISRHKCAICGKTEVTNPELLFRYCSKCTQGQEYCSDHLFTHTHR